MAIVLLGICLDVEVLFKEPLKGRAGEYVGISDDKPTHLVHIHPDLDASTANRILWHEMAHAMQVERSGGLDTFNEAYERSMESAGIVDPDLHASIGEVDISADEEVMLVYRSTPFEFEADLLAGRYAVDHAVII